MQNGIAEVTSAKITLTKKKLEEMYLENMRLAGKVGGIASAIGIGVLFLFCLLPGIIMLTSGMPFHNALPIMLCLFGFSAVFVIVQALVRKSMDKVYRAIVDGRFRLLSDQIAHKYQESDMDTDTHIMTHTYYITGVAHPEDRRMFAAWWSMSAAGDPIYILETANKKGKYRHCEVLPARIFTLDQEMMNYIKE